MDPLRAVVVSWHKELRAPTLAVPADMPERVLYGRTRETARWRVSPCVAAKRSSHRVSPVSSCSSAVESKLVKSLNNLPRLVASVTG